MLLMRLVLGGLISLPWVLMAECLPQNHFAKLALAITWLGALALSLESLLITLALLAGYTIGIPWIVGAEMAVFAAAVAFRPRMTTYGS